MWRHIAGTDHEVSDSGSIRNTNTGRLRVAKATNSAGYRLVRMFRHGIYKTFSVHRLVAECFIGPCQPDRVVNHIDGNKANNAASNLEYVTVSENARHAYAMGLSSLPTRKATGQNHWTHKTPERVKRGDENGARLHPERILRGHAVPSAKLTEGDVNYIRSARRFFGHSEIQLAAAFGVSRRNINHIINRKSWRHLP